MRLDPLISLAGLTFVSLASKVTVDVAGLLPEYCGAPLVESSAWIRHHSQELFWSYIDHITSKPDSTVNIETILSALKEVDKESTLNGDLLKAALKSRSQSPSAAIYSSLYSSLSKRTAVSDYAPCRSWLQYGPKHLCRPEKLPKLVARLVEGKMTAGKPEDLVPEFDNFISRDLGSFPVLVLWADPEDVGSWAAWHKALAKQASIGEITYVLRFIIKHAGCKLESAKISMTGYGASFEVKMEDGQESIKASMEDSKTILSSLGMSVSSLDSYKIVTSLPEDSLHDLGLQVTKLITDSFEPLSAFKNIVSNLPLLVSSIVKGSKPEKSFIEKIATIQRRYQLFPQMELLAVNGIMVESSGFSLPGLQSFAARYAALYSGIKEYFDCEQAQKLLRAAIVKQTPTFDTRSSAVIWLNDLEKDEQFANEPKQLRSILRHSNTGFYSLARNLVNAVLFIDPGHRDAPRIMEQIKKGWISQGAPIRFGIVLSNGFDKDDIAVLIRSFYAVVREHGNESALLFLNKYFEEKKDEEEDVDLEVCYKVVASHKDLLEDIADATESRESYSKVRDLNNRLTIGSEPIVFINGRPTLINSFDHDIVEAYKHEIAELQQLVFKNELTDGMADLYDKLLGMRNAHQHRNTLFSESKGAFFDATKLSKEHTVDLLDERRYMYPAKNQRGSKSFRPTTASIWIVVDVHRRHELDLIHSALSFLQKTDSTARVQLLLANPVDRHLKSVMISYREMLKGNFDLDKFAGHLEKSVGLRAGATEHLKRPGPHGRSADYEMALGVRHMVQATMMACGVGPSYKDPMIFVNGRLVATVGRDDPKIAPEHFEMLVERENIRLEIAKDILPLSHKDYSDIVIKASSFQAAAIEAIQSSFGTGGRDFGAFPMTIPDLPTFRVGSKSSLVQVQAVIDPLTTVAQRYASIVSACADASWFSGQTWLNPIPKLAHLPLPVFYRFAQEAPMTFSLAQEGKFAVQPDAPPAWDTVLDDGSIDPDNISGKGHAGDFDEDNQQVKFKLRGLVVEAKLDLPTSTGRSLAGLQVLARDRFTSEIIEEVPVMGEVNIAQFGKLGGRLYYLEVEEAASKTLSMTRASSFAASSGRNLKHIELKQHLPLDAKTNLSVLSPTKSTNNGKINVFSIASGAMYERLIRIMMTSVSKRCQDPVKFWLIDTFVTPQFRETVKSLADHYGFEYEFVHFRWPVWLRRQVKKHRTVWAYKVLFLDQIFPKNLGRVVYVDADQVVRSDLKELVKTDMKGAPWGFVPFCDSRKETDQFRFWKTGYWKTVLEEKPYHISALFLLDLKVLRESGLGDRLRRDYHMLSIDPNSLANLDQDLPNHMQDDHPIHSLPQEWLWCETWCSDETKLKAKSIDLCNYPGKKETKVEQGQRIIPEWKEYDHEIKFILDKHIKQKADL